MYFLGDTVSSQYKTLKVQDYIFKKNCSQIQSYLKPLLQHNVKSKNENPQGDWIACNMYEIACCRLDENRSCLTSRHLSLLIYEHVPLSPKRRTAQLQCDLTLCIFRCKFFKIIFEYIFRANNLPVGVVQEDPSRFPPKKNLCSRVCPFSSKKSWRFKSLDVSEENSKSLPSPSVFFITGPSWKWNELSSWT